MNTQFINILEDKTIQLADINQQLKTMPLNYTDPQYIELLKKQTALETIVIKYNQYKALENEYKDLIAMSKHNDIEISKLAIEELEQNKQKQASLEQEIQQLIHIDKDDDNISNVIVEIKGAVGGDEANLFAGDLFHMYINYCLHMNWTIKVLDEHLSERGGYSAITFMVNGKQAYRYLKAETGVHRVQRIPKTEMKGRVHTSTATVLVMPEIKTNAITLKTEDLKVDRYHAQGAGGQNVNKVETAVRIKHIPTGIVVSCQTEKSQLQNYNICLKMLTNKLTLLAQEEEFQKKAEFRITVGNGDRNEKIRTYNYHQNRITDHRINYTVYNLDKVMEGNLDDIIEHLVNIQE